MKCIFCGSELSRVVDKRAVGSSGEIRRRRECLKCRKRYTTYERAVVAELVVVKRDGRREAFSSEKLLRGLILALEKCPNASKASLIAEKIETKLRAKGTNEVTSKAIGQMVLLELKKIDKIAYLRFVSVYRHYQDPSDFVRELESLEVAVS